MTCCLVFGKNKRGIKDGLTGIPVCNRSPRFLGPGFFRNGDRAGVHIEAGMVRKAVMLSLAKISYFVQSGEI
jgi:hypothetical protein